jgi:predicted secreted protein
MRKEVLKRGNFISGTISALFFIYISLFFAQVVACKGITNREGVMNDENVVIVHKKDNGKEIQVRRGDVIQIELEGMGSTGYKWHVDAIDVERVELLTEETVSLKKEGVVGAPVLEIWRLKALKEGKADIKMDYYREWEGIERAREHFVIRLNIQQSR